MAPLLAPAPAQAFYNLQREAVERRRQTNWMQQNIDAIAGLVATAVPLRETWASWNPQRAEAKRLERLVKEGSLTLQVRGRGGGGGGQGGGAWGGSK